MCSFRFLWLCYEFASWTFIISINTTRLLIWNLNRKCSHWIIGSNHWRCSTKKLLLQISKYSQKALMLESLFNQVAGLQVCNFVKKRLRQRYFSMKIASFQKHLFWRKSVNGCYWIMSYQIFHSFFWKLQNRCSYKCFLILAEKHLCMNVFCNCRPPI